jgi:hypothetical protein
MPPKDQKPKANPQDNELQTKQAELADINRVCGSREQMLMLRSEQLQRSKLESLNLKKRIAELNEKFESEEQLTKTTCADMFRMYRHMQKELVLRIENHQATIKQLHDELDESRQILERTKAEKDASIAERTRKINEQKQRMEEMAIGFGVRLKETLEEMSRQIDTGSAGGTQRR